MRIIYWLSISIRIIIICLALYLLALILWPDEWAPTFQSLEHRTITSMDNEPDAYEKQLMSIDDSLPHYTYQRISDSIQYIQNLEKSSNDLFMSGWGFDFTGFYKRETKGIVVYDSAYRKHTMENIPDTAYFISLNRYYLKKDHSTFRKNDTTFLKYPVITKRDTINHRIFGHYEIKPLRVDVRDLPDKTDNTQEQKRDVLIKVSKTQYTWYVIIITPIAFLIIWLYLWGVLLQIIRTIEEIANKEVFRKKTYRRCYIITASLWGGVVIEMIITYILNMYFSTYIDQAFYLRFLDFLSNGMDNIIGGFIAFCLGHAFKKGYQLQQEQELTI